MNSHVQTNALSPAVIEENERQLIHAARDVFSLRPLTLQGPDIEKIGPRLTLAAALALPEVAELRISRGLITTDEWAHACESFRELFGCPIDTVVSAPPGWRPLPHLETPPGEQRFCLHDDYWVAALKRKHAAQRADGQLDSSLPAIPEAPSNRPKEVEPPPGVAAVICVSTVEGQHSPEVPSTMKKLTPRVGTSVKSLVRPQVLPCRFATEGRWRVFYESLKNDDLQVRERVSFRSQPLNKLAKMVHQAETDIVGLYRLLIKSSPEGVVPGECYHKAWAAIRGLTLCALIQEDCDVQRARARVWMKKDCSYLFAAIKREYGSFVSTQLDDCQYEPGFKSLQERTERLLPANQQFSPHGIHERVKDALRSLGLAPYEGHTTSGGSEESPRRNSN